LAYREIRNAKEICGVYRCVCLISFWGYRGREWDFLLGGTSSRAEDESEKILVANAKRGSIVKKVHLAQQKEQKAFGRRTVSWYRRCAATCTSSIATLPSPTKNPTKGLTTKKPAKSRTWSTSTKSLTNYPATIPPFIDKPPKTDSKQETVFAGPDGIFPAFSLDKA
jgi:hypothetical protein